jgi:PmbA protein
MPDIKNFFDDSGRIKMTDASSYEKYKYLAEWMVSFARSSGADEIEVVVISGNEFSADVRNGSIESLVEAGSRHIGFRLRKDQKTASASSSDLEKGILKQLVLNALERAQIASRDPYAGLPKQIEPPLDAESLLLFDPSINEMDSKKKINLAIKTEKIALLDNRITNSHGAGFETQEVHTTIANSTGFLQQYKETFCSLGVGLQAGDTNHIVEGSWSCTKRFLCEIESPEIIAKKAVYRTIRQLNSRKIKTQNVPVIFEPRMTSWLMGFLFSCVSGSAIYQKTSFLAGRLGERIGNPFITVIDDGTMPGKLGTTPFDAEGIPSQKTFVMEKGILKNYLCNTYAARKLKLESTGNADGGGIGPTNFYLQNGTSPPDDIIASMEKGLILTRTIGHGLNPVNGDISRGAFGLWVEDGQVIYPVSEITISGNLGGILNNIEMVGNDLEFRSSVCGPTIKVGELTIAGKSG